MRILIIGEFSSFSKNLSAGFRLLGHECFVFSWGDGFKRISQDGDCYNVRQPIERIIPNPFRSVIYKTECYCSFVKLRRFVSHMSRTTSWDAVLVLNPGFIKKKFWQNLFTREMVLSLVKNPNKVYLSACGRDVPYHDYWSKQEWKNRGLINQGVEQFLSPSSINHFNYCMTFIHKVIPVMYDYAEAWRKSVYSKNVKVLPTIPLPVDTSRFTSKNELREKIVIFHGIIRPEGKGTTYIVEAMNRLQDKYPDKVECIAKGGMPLNEYLELLMRTNILIDQVYAGSSGMNALYALAQGKVLLGGNEPENEIEYQYPGIPIVNIRNDSDMIFEKLENLVNHPDKIKRLSIEGRKYVAAVHDNKVVAKRYIELFGNYD